MVGNLIDEALLPSGVNFSFHDPHVETLSTCLTTLRAPLPLGINRSWHQWQWPSQRGRESELLNTPYGATQNMRNRHYYGSISTTQMNTQAKNRKNFPPRQFLAQH